MASNLSGPLTPPRRHLPKGQSSLSENENRHPNVGQGYAPPDYTPSIQDTLEDTLDKIRGLPSHIAGCGIRFFAGIMLSQPKPSEGTFPGPEENVDNNEDVSLLQKYKK